MKGPYIRTGSPYYWLRLYNKHPKPGEPKRVSECTKIPVTAADLHGKQQAKAAGTKYKLQGNAALRDLIKIVRAGMVERSIEDIFGIRIKHQLTPSQGLSEYFSLKPNLKPKTKSIYLHSIKILNDAIPEKPISEYTHQDMVRYIAFMQKPQTAKTAKAKDGFKQSSISIITMHLSAVWNFFVKQKYAKENVIIKVKAPPPLPDPIPAEDLKAIISHFENGKYREWEYFVKFLLYTGVRPGGAINQRWEWVNFTDSTIKLFNEKSDKYYFFPLHDELLKLLTQMQIRESGPMFTFKSYHSLHFFPRQMNVMMGKKLNGSDDPNGVKIITRKYSLYNLRDSFATEWANKIGIAFVKDLLNHSDDRVTRIYGAVHTKSLRTLMDSTRQAPNAQDDNKSQ